MSWVISATIRTWTNWCHFPGRQRHFVLVKTITIDSED